MVTVSKLLDELKTNPKKVRFSRLCNIAEAFGFQMRKGSGSHRVYYREGIWEILNFLDDGGWAKTLPEFIVFKTKNAWKALVRIKRGGG
jgi:hypothetical protein